MAGFDVEHQIYPYGIHIAVVQVDRETGGVAVERYVIAYDIGRAINPMLVDGQIVGGFAQGLGGALYRGVHLQRARRTARRRPSPII